MTLIWSVCISSLDLLSFWLAESKSSQTFNLHLIDNKCTHSRWTWANVSWWRHAAFTSAVSGPVPLPSLPSVSNTQSLSPVCPVLCVVIELNGTMRRPMGFSSTLSSTSLQWVKPATSRPPYTLVRRIVLPNISPQALQRQGKW